MSKEHQARRLDVRRFAEEGARLEGAETLALFPRLREESTEEGAERVVRWTAVGELRNPGHVHPQCWLTLEAQARLALVCQRCLGPVDIDVAFSRAFRFAPDEATAAAEDDEAEEDVLALSPVFDLVTLVEDELLMDMPPAPRHVICPVPVTMSSTDADFEAASAEVAHPFAMLAALKGGKSRE